MTKTKTRKGYMKTLLSGLAEGADQVMKAWRTQAKRPDRVGNVTYRGLELVHGSVGVAVRSLSRLEKATQVPHRAATPPHAIAAEAPAKRPRGGAVPVHHGVRPKRHEQAPNPS